MGKNALSTNDMRHRREEPALPNLTKANAKFGLIKIEYLVIKFSVLQILKTFAKVDCIAHRHTRTTDK